MQPLLDVVIVHWKSSAVLRGCLASLFGSVGSGFSLGRVIAVDNSWVDGCARVLEQFPEVQLIENPENQGFAAGCNRGAKNSRADYLLFLNPDVVLSPGAVEKVIEFFEAPEGTSVGICGIRL